MTTGKEYHDAWVSEGAGHGAYTAVAKKFGVHPSTVQQAVKRYQARQGLDPAVKHGMDVMGMELPPGSGWIKSHEPDENGLTYSYHFSNKAEEETAEQRMAAIEDRFRSIPPVKFKVEKQKGGRKKRAFISINDLHAGALAWGQETGYGDWDLDIALTRLRMWTARLLTLVKAEGVDEIILFYNGDTLHANGKVPMTATQGTSHVLDVDTRQFKTVDRTAETIIFVADQAAQIANVRLVIKPGNHDGDSYLALLQGAKWRYAQQKNVTVEMDPSAYWAYVFGKVALFGHHGDKIKFEKMVMRFLQQFRKEIAAVEHIVVWTGHKHERLVQQFPGVVVEQASAWTEPDEFGSHYGNNAMAQAVIYDEEQGEVARFTVKEVADA